MSDKISDAEFDFLDSAVPPEPSTVAPESHDATEEEEVAEPTGMATFDTPATSDHDTITELRDPRDNPAESPEAIATRSGTEIAEPTQTTTETAEAPESPSEAASEVTSEEPEEAENTQEAAQEEPVQAVTPDLPLPAEPGPGDLFGADTVPRARVETTEIVAALWDQMLGELSQPTRNALWEQGLQGMANLLAVPKTDLLHPRGSLNSHQLAEVEAWVTAHGLKLKVTPTRQAIMASRPVGAPATIRSETPEDRTLREQLVEEHKKIRRC